MTDEIQESNQDAAPPEPTVEDAAREMGWRPKEEFKGEEGKWVDAETFVKRGEEILPILKAQSKKDREALKAAQEQIAEMKKTFSEFKEHHSRTEQRALQKAREELERELAEAVDAKDFAAVKSITKDMADLSKDVQTDANGDPYAAPDHAEAVSQWKGENPWYDADVAMTAAANAIATQLEQRGVKGKEQLEEVAKRIRAEFPHKFENERRKAPATVEGASPPRKGGKTWADLPPEARKAADKWVKEGLVTREQYLKDYFS